jgi:hypothetical protein
VQLNHTDGTATAVKTFPAPDDLSARSQGNTQALPNGNIFVNWGQAGAVTEFDSKDGSVLFHAYLDSKPEGKLVESYRGFRSNWTGFPFEEADIVALKEEDGKTEVYVSWNGDTETTLWRFYRDSSRKELLGETQRTSFETKFTYKEHGLHQVLAEAIDESGNTLVRTRTVEIQAAVHPAWHRSEFVMWEEQNLLGNQEL